jgi:hypothetical protein
MCASVIAGRMTQSIAYPLLVNGALERSQFAAVPAIARPGIVMLLLFGTAGILGDRVTSATWVTWILGTSSSAGLFLTIAVVAGLHRHHRRPLLSRVRAMALPVWRSA